MMLYPFILSTGKITTLIKPILPNYLYSCAHTLWYCFKSSDLFTATINCLQPMLIAHIARSMLSYFSAETTSSAASDWDRLLIVVLRLLPAVSIIVNSLCVVSIFLFLVWMLVLYSLSLFVVMRNQANLAEPLPTSRVFFSNSFN